MTMRSNKAIVNAAGQTITTAGLAAGGALNPEQAKKFIQQTFEATPLSGLVRHELRSAKTGEIDKIGVGRRLLRKKTENTDDGYRSGVKHGKLEYACTPVRLPWEITEETLRENIEGSNYETIVTNLMTRQIGCDREDLCLNGDERYAKVKEFSSSETYAIGDLVAYNKKVYQYTAAHTAGAFDAGEATELGTVDDADFLKVNDGWVKQFKEGGHVVDVTHGTKNTSVTISGLGEILVLQDRAAVEVSWDSFFPAAYFPGIQTPFMLSSPDAMMQRLFEWKISAKPVHLILTGTRVNFYAAIQSLQPYRKGGDPGSIYYKIKLKEYREVRIRQVKVSSTGTATVSGGSTRTDNRVQAKTYTVKPGDCLYNISKSTLGDGGRYKEIYSLNKDKLKNPNLIYPGQVLQLP